jgi:bacterioferritin
MTSAAGAAARIGAWLARQPGEQERFSMSNQDIIEKLQLAYTKEMETVLNYVANSIQLDGVRAEKIKEALKADITEELNHGTLLGNRIKTIGGAVPGSLGLKFKQSYMQPPADTTDVVSVIKGVIQAENDACNLYLEIIKLCEGRDYVTQDLAITIMGDEEEHRRAFEGFLREYAK